MTRRTGWWAALRLCLALFLAAALPLAAMARDAPPLADDPVVEQRLIAIAAELRCLVCQNESLAGSRADLAEDLRRQIREMIHAGKTDAEIMDYLVSRYGDFVRYRPPMKPTTWLLWLGPFALLGGGVIGLALFVRRRRVVLQAQAPLSGDERARAAALLASDAE